MEHVRGDAPRDLAQPPRELRDGGAVQGREPNERGVAHVEVPGAGGDGDVAARVGEAPCEERDLDLHPARTAVGDDEEHASWCRHARIVARSAPRAIVVACLSLRA